MSRCHLIYFTRDSTLGKTLEGILLESYPSSSLQGGEAIATFLNGVKKAMK